MEGEIQEAYFGNWAKFFLAPYFFKIVDKEEKICYNVSVQLDSRARIRLQITENFFVLDMGQPVKIFDPTQNQ